MGACVRMLRPRPGGQFPLRCGFARMSLSVDEAGLTGERSGKG